MKNIIFVCLMVGILPLPSMALASAKVPDFSQYKDVNQKKTAFFEFMLPHIEKSNAEVIKTRNFLEALSSNELSKQQSRLIALAETYRVSHKDKALLEVKRALLKKVDVIPPSLALAQAANESGWGTSRFARKASNFYGQWCFTKGCGLVPSQRTTGKSHEVRKFDSAYASVKGYIHNLNTQPAYAQLREIRYQKRQEQQRATGLDLVVGLLKYSERKQEYVKELSSMIRYNNLSRYDS
ncbi:MAG: glucosaminidase domain-containing protein [Pseudomonadota bacterium]